VNRLSALLNALRPNRVDPSEIRAETWNLGNRHHGEVLEGARSELNAPGITARQAILLRAVIRSLAR
jgi:hypothetical protein